ncbi:GntR family transcriptional regulator [Streptomyces sp. NPDC090106]|uniref:GntR family transcriptional regulator n=1 Tax=Streptomyces sp. NPDC090106 TaxID=3365946 RepID=UPI0038094DA9
MSPAARHPVEEPAPDASEAQAGPKVSADSGLGMYRQVRQDLIDGTIDPGSLLLETALGSRYGVSRTPVREALNRLEQDGLVERVPRGYRVPVITAEDILELYEARIALEATAASAAALRRTDLDLARITHHHERLMEATGTEEAADASAAFHKAVWHAGHNAIVFGLLDRLITQMRLFDRAPTVEPAKRELTHEEHARLIDAIRDHDADAARREVVAHLGRNRDVRLAALARTLP